MLCGAGLRVAVLCGRGSLAVLGCELRVIVDRWLCSVVLGYGWLFRFLGWRDMVLGGCFVVVLVFGFDDGETKMRDRDGDERQS